MENEMRALILNQVAKVKLVYISQVKASERILIRCSEDSHNIFRTLWDEGRIGLVEEFKVLFLNQANKVIGLFEVSTGGVTGTVADPRIILAAALEVLACSLILAHNHPSGNLKPSRSDEDLTRKIGLAAGLHDIKVLDHLILNDEGFFSFADQGLM